MTAHEQYVRFRQLEGYTYDEADDGPEVGLIRSFLAFPEGAQTSHYWRIVRDSRA